MTESVELLLSFCLCIALAFLVVTWIWKAKANNSFSCRLAQFLTYTALLAINAGLLAVHYLTGKNYVFNLLGIFAWLVCMVLSVLNMRN